MKNSIRTIIVDDNVVAVNNLKNHFSNNENIKVVASFSNGEEALEYIINHKDSIDLLIL
mgnify:FL=1